MNSYLYKELEFTLNHEFDFSACEQKYATYITKDGKEESANLLRCIFRFCYAQAKGKNHYYANEKSII